LDKLFPPTAAVAAPPKAAAATPKPDTPSEPKRIQVSRLEPGKLLYMVQPAYPPIAKTAHVEGSVELRAVIGTDGRVKEVTIVSGHALLRLAAQQAVAQWVYKPPVLNGESVEIVAPIEVVFRLGDH
jgi:protein TonB